MSSEYRVAGIPSSTFGRTLRRLAASASTKQARMALRRIHLQSENHAEASRKLRDLARFALVARILSLMLSAHSRSSQADEYGRGNGLVIEAKKKQVRRLALRSQARVALARDDNCDVVRHD